MKLTTTVFGVALVLGSLGLIARPATAQNDADPQWEVIRLALRPADAPTPALKYRLLPPPWKQKPGNAAVVYGQLDNLEKSLLDESLREAVKNASDKPLSELRENAEWMNRLALVEWERLLRQAASLQYADWQVEVERGISMRLHHLNSLMTVSRVGTIAVRRHIANHEYDQAMETLAGLNQMSRFTGEGQSVLELLVGVATQHLALKSLDDWVQQDRSPNLYWALTNLPRPTIDARRAIAQEGRMYIHTLTYDFLPESTIKTTVLSEPQAAKIHQQLAPMMDGNKLAQQIVGYGRMKKELAGWGYDPSLLEQMPVAQVVAIHTIEEMERVYGELEKAFTLPYHQALPYLQQYDQLVEKKNQDSASGMNFPLLGRAKYLYDNLQRQVDVLRIIEAIRMYAAQHNGKLPASLDDLPVPISEDLITGKPFVYRIEGDTGILLAPPPPHAGDRGWRYELTIQP